MIKAVIFDLGGVVIDWTNQITYDYIEEKYGIDSETAKKILEEKLPLVQEGKLGEKDWLKEFFVSAGMEPPEDYEKIWTEKFDESKYNEGIMEIVKALKKNGYVVAALSNVEPSHAAWEEERGIRELFDTVVFSFEVKSRKPQPQIYKTTIDAIGLRPEECVYIDDLPENVKGAEDVGMKAILNKGDAEQLKKDLKKYGVKID